MLGLRAACRRSALSYGSRISIRCFPLLPSGKQDGSVATFTNRDYGRNFFRRSMHESGQESVDGLKFDQLEAVSWATIKWGDAFKKSPVPSLDILGSYSDEAINSAGNFTSLPGTAAALEEPRAVESLKIDSVFQSLEKASIVEPVKVSPGEEPLHKKAQAASNKVSEVSKSCQATNAKFEKLFHHQDAATLKVATFVLNTLREARAPEHVILWTLHWRRDIFSREIYPRFRANLKVWRKLGLNDRTIVKLIMGEGKMLCSSVLSTMGNVACGSHSISKTGNRSSNRAHESQPGAKNRGNAGNNPTLVSMNSSEMADRLAGLYGLGFKDIDAFLQKAFWVLLYSRGEIDARLYELKAIFGEDAQLAHMIMQNPNILAMPLEEINRKVEVLAGFLGHKDAQKLFVKHPKILKVAWDRVESNVLEMERVFGRENTLSIIMSQHLVLRVPWSRTFPKIDFITNTMCRDMQSIVSWPSVLCLSLENRLEPRYEALQSVGQGHSWCFSKIFGIRDKEFEANFRVKLPAKRKSSL